MMYEKEKDMACQVALLASRVCLQVFQGGDKLIRRKEGGEGVTVADFASQALILGFIQDLFPHDGVLAEEDAGMLARDGALLEGVRALVAGALGLPLEGEEVLRWVGHRGEGDSGRVWLVDPVDGTEGFIQGEQFAVAIALLEGGRPVLGVLSCPNLLLNPQNPLGPRGLLFGTALGQGAWATPVQGGGPWVPVRVQAKVRPWEARLVESVTHGDHERSAAVAQRLGVSRMPLRVESQVKYAMVARGQAHLYLRVEPKGAARAWDHAPGVVLIQEAGGEVTDLDGRELDFSEGEMLRANRGLVVSAGVDHRLVMEAVRSAESSGQGTPS